MQKMRDSNPCTAVFFVRNPMKALKKNFTAKNRKSYENSRLKTANLTQIHHFHRIHRKKMRVLCGENYFFVTAIHRNSYIIFQPNLDPGLE